MKKDANKNKSMEDLDIGAIIIDVKGLRASMRVMLKSIEGYFSDHGFDCYEAEAMINQLEQVIKLEMSAFDRIFEKLNEAGIKDEAEA